jgi:outer membrane protein assembly factor BamE
MNRQLPRLILLAASLLLSACSVDSLPFVYRPDLNQGMIITQEMVDQLKVGMSRRQVAFIMGPPPVVDSFQPDRWDYIEAHKPGGGDFESKRLSVFFEDDRLVAVSGDFQPQDPALQSGS